MKSRSNRGLRILIALVITVVGYAIYDYQSEQRTEKKKSETSLILNWPADQISQLEISADSFEMALKKSVDGWFFEKPLSEKADSDAIAQFVDGLVLEKSSQVALENEKIDWGVYGLDKPKATIKVTNNAGKQVAFRVGTKKNFQGDSYLRRDDDNKVLVASSTWFQKAERRVYDFRDKRWARVEPADITQVQVKIGKEKLTLNKKDKDWSLAEKPQWKIDPNKARKLISSLTANQIQNFSLTADSPANVFVEIALKDGKSWRGEFGVTKDKKHYLKIKDFDLTVEVSAADIKDLYNLSADTLRDRREPFQFRKEDVKTVELAMDGRSAILDGTQSSAVLVGLLGLEVGEFSEKTDDPSLHGGGSNRLTAKDANNQVVIELQWSGAGAKRWVRSNLSPKIFTVSEENLKSLNLESTFFPKEEKK